MENNINEKAIKFYRNYAKGRFYVSGKNHKGKWFYLNKSKEFNGELYLDNEMFIKGLEIDKQLLKIVDGTDNVLVFRNAEDEKIYCVTKEEIEQKKQQRQNKKKSVDASVETMIRDAVKELIDYNGLSYADDGIIARLLNKEEEQKNEELQPIDDEDLPF